MKEQPFYIGQKVVAVKNHSQGAFKIGDRFVIKQVRRMCCYWGLDIGMIDPAWYIYSREPDQCNIEIDCDDCGKKIIDNTPNSWYDSLCFAPLQEGFESITFEKVLETELTSVN